MRFPPEFIDRLKHHLPLSEVVGRRVTIKRHGREFQGLCPFHKEKSPSFTVSDDKGFFHCFGCSAHGDAIGFIMDYEKVTYPEAVEKLAGEAGMPLPVMTHEAEETERKRHTLEDALAAAQRWFAEQLRGNGGAQVRDYLRDRGLSEETIQRFGLGFAPNAREMLKGALMKQNIPEAMLKDAGLLATPDDGASYDRFRGRLIFPIRNARGKVVAFGGRILPWVQNPNAAKYLNSPETLLFKKGEMLFAYDIAKDAARDGASFIVGEGYMDVIAMHQAGFTTAVAPLGTAITDTQLKLLWRMGGGSETCEPILCLDGDEAGSRAMLRAAELAAPMLKPGLSLRFAGLPKGEDPDSFIRKSGAAAMKNALAQARVLSDVIWNHALSRFGADTAERKAQMQDYLRQFANRIEDPAVRRSFQEYFDSRSFALRQRPKGSGKPIASTPLGPLPAAEDDASHLKRLENQLAALVILYPEILYHPDVEEHFGHMDVSQPFLDKLRASALEIMGYLEPLDSAALRAELIKRGHGETVEMLLQSTFRHFSKNLANDAAAAARAWLRSYDNYTMAALEHEKREAGRMLEQDMSQANLDRLLALQHQIDEFRRARYTAQADEQVS